MQDDHQEHEALVHELNDPELRAAYAAPYNNYKTGLIASVLGWLLVTSGTLMYGRKPSYGKFKAIEVIARIPYQSWEVASYTLLTAFYGNEKKAIDLTKTGMFSRMAQDNETMHVVVITKICKERKCVGPVRHMLIPLIFAFFYFWTIYLLYMLHRKSALELNNLFENHAFHQYQQFLDENEAALKERMCMSDFLTLYGRHVRSEYELFETIRNDELIHRNRSIRELEARTN